MGISVPRSFLDDARVHWSLELREVVRSDIAPTVDVLRYEFVIKPRPLLGVMVGDVAKRDVNVHQRSGHTKSFITKASVQERNCSFGDGDALGVERKGHCVTVSVERRVIAGRVQDQLGVCHKLADVFYLASLADATSSAHTL